jgi:hypothetical protein
MQILTLFSLCSQLSLWSQRRCRVSLSISLKSNLTIITDELLPTSLSSCMSRIWPNSTAREWSQSHCAPKAVHNTNASVVNGFPKQNRVTLSFTVADGLRSRKCRRMLHSSSFSFTTDFILDGNESTHYRILKSCDLQLLITFGSKFQS